MINAAEHLGLVGMHAKRYAKRAESSGWTRDDIFQEGVLGLYRAAELYDPNRGAFSIYASFWISHFILRFLEEHSSTVRVPVNLQAKRRKNGEKTTPRIHSIDAPVAGEDGLSYHDVLPGASDSAHDACEREELRTIVRRTLAEMMTGKKIWKKDTWLTDRECEIIQARFYDGLTLEQVGDKYNVSRERIRQVEETALVKIKVRLERALDA